MLLFLLGRLILAKNLKKKYLNVKDKFVWVLGFEECKNFEWCIKVSGDSVVHQYELSFRWRDFQCLVEDKFSIVDTLMEIAIIKNDVTRCVAVGHCDILTQDEFQTRIVSQVAFHLY